MQGQRRDGAQHPQAPVVYYESGCARDRVVGHVSARSRRLPIEGLLTILTMDSADRRGSEMRINDTRMTGLLLALIPTCARPSTLEITGTRQIRPHVGSRALKQSVCCIPKQAPDPLERPHGSKIEDSRFSWNSISSKRSAKVLPVAALRSSIARS